LFVTSVGRKSESDNTGIWRKIDLLGIWQIQFSFNPVA